MTRSSMSAALAALAALLLVAPVALAHTCCGSTAVVLDPSETVVGATVELVGLTCEADERMPLETLTGFWLTTQARDSFLEDPARPDPASWHPFASIEDPTATVGSATITVPDLPDGRYYLWWACRETAGETASYVLQWSEGGRLVVGSPPTDCPAPPTTFAAFGALGSTMPMADVVDCLGRTDLTFVAYSGPPHGIGGTLNGIAPEWLGEPLSYELFLHEDATDEAAMAFVAIRPGSGVSLPDGQWVRVTGHHNDPAAETCRSDRDPADPAYQEPVQFCRERFVLTSVTTVSVPETATIAADPRAAPAGGEPWMAVLGGLAMLLVARRTTRRLAEARRARESGRGRRC